MSDAFNSFVKFISEDPLMLGLCIAIVVLIVVFIIVLCTGGKKKSVKEEPVEENTTQLLASDINDEPLKSTQEFNMSSLREEQEKLESTINVPNVDAITDDMTEKEAPISLEEAIHLRNTREENDIKDTIKIPVVSETPSTPVDIPAETPTIPEIPSIDDDMSDLTIPEEKVEEISDIELPTMANEAIKETGASQPFSSVYLNSNREMPKVEEDFSKTEIIRHIPVMESPSPSVIEPAFSEPSEDLDDIDLPKLNTDTENSVLSSLTGETFDIK